MNSDLKRLIEFLDFLDEERIYYRLNKVRDSIMIEIAVPGERIEVEFMAEGTIEVEKFKSYCDVEGYDNLKDLKDFISKFQ